MALLISKRCAQVLKEGKVTPASDVYSFAILMYELYTCKHLFKGMMHSQVSTCLLLSEPLGCTAIGQAVILMCLRSWDAG